MKEEKEYLIIYEFKKFYEINNKLICTEQLKHIHRELKKYYNVGNFEDAEVFLNIFNATISDVSRLRAVLLVSKSFKDNPYLKKVLSDIEKQIEIQIGRKVL